MVSEKTIKDTKGNKVGFEVEGAIIETTDYGATIEIRPKREQSATVKVEDFEGSFEERPHGHGDWEIGQKLRVIIVPENIKISIEAQA